MVITPTGIDDTEASETGLAIYPNPVTTKGMITFFLKSGDQVVINLYASDGRLAESLFSGMLDAGEHSIPWYPSPAIAPGVYTLELSHRSGVAGGWHHAARRWVIMR
jgi:hypothetical protein